MTAAGNKRISVEWIVIALLLAGLGISSFFLIRSVKNPEKYPYTKDVINVAPQNFQGLENLMKSIGLAPAFKDRGNLLVSELRVVAIGSAYPIPYEAEVCPFTQISQPSMNQLDRDGDGITDDWEQKFGLNRYDIADAAQDFDGDGFSNLEEFEAGSDPVNPDLHPPYAEKLRFIQRKEIDFPLVFQGFTELGDGSMAFQLNNPVTGKSHFLSEGERAEHIVVKRFEKDPDGRNHRLFVERDGFEIELQRGEVALDPESKAELINILDRSRIMVTMGALLSLHSDEYTVLSVSSDKVVLKDIANGKVYDIVGLTEAERERSTEE